jgi:hypothetical protein
MLTTLERFSELTITVHQSCARIDVTGGAKTFGDIVQRDIFGTQLVLLIFEVGSHMSFKLVLFGLMGGYGLQVTARTKDLCVHNLARRQATAT